MKYLLIVGAAALALLGNWPASAADMPVINKAPTFNFASSNFYIGLETGAAVAKSNIGGTDLFATSLVHGNLTAAGGTIGACAGWISGHAGSWWGLHSCVDYQNITASASVLGTDAGVASRWSATQEVRIGGGILGWFTSILPNLGVTGVTFPTFTPPSINGGINLAAAPHTYFAFGVSEQGVRGNFGAAGGTTVEVAPLLKMGAIWQSLDATGRANGGAVDAYASVVFATKGKTFDNVFGAGGGPVLASGAVSMGNTYKAGLGYYFTVPTAYAR